MANPNEVAMDNTTMPYVVKKRPEDSSKARHVINKNLKLSSQNAATTKAETAARPIHSPIVMVSVYLEAPVD